MNANLQMQNESILEKKREMSNPEKMGTSMWINGSYSICGQDREGIEQVAHLVGIVSQDFSPTTGRVEGMLTEKYL